MTETFKIKRHQFATYLNVGTDATAKYARIGLGVPSQEVAYNPTVNTENYIHEENATNSVDSYAPNIPTQQTCYKGDPVFEYVDTLRINRATGTDADTDLLMVYFYNKEGESYVAEKQRVTIQIDSFGGEATAPTKINYTILFNGNPELGKVTKGSDGTVTFTKNTVGG